MRFRVNQTLPLAALVLLGGCIPGGGHAAPDPEPVAINGPAADYPVVIGDPFTIDGVTYNPVDKLNYDAVGYASSSSEGGSAIAIAHKTLPLPSYAEVTALDSGKTILVRVVRRGPMTNDRLIELSPGAAAQLGVTGQDKTAVRVRRVNPPEVERAMLRSGARAPERMDTPPSLLAVLKRKLNPQAPVILPSPVAVAPPAAIVSLHPHLAGLPHPHAAPSPRPTSPSPRPTPPSAASPTPAAGHIYVQVAAFSERQHADAAAAKLGGQVQRGQRFSRVRMGPFATRAEAQAALAKARAAGYRDAVVQRGN